MPDIRMPDGTIIQNVPDGVTKAELMGKFEKLQLSTGQRVQETPDVPPPKPNFSVPDDIIEHLKLREDEVNKVYLDSRKKLTAGVGHLLTEDELKTMKLDDEVSQDQVDTWLEQDSKKAYLAALDQATQLGLSDNADFIKALTSVNFQLGTNWNKKFTKTWDLMERGLYKQAAVEAADSAWNKQTPTRTKDFQVALNALPMPSLGITVRPTPEGLGPPVDLPDMNADLTAELDKYK